MSQFYSSKETTRCSHTSIYIYLTRSVSSFALLDCSFFISLHTCEKNVTIYLYPSEFFVSQITRRSKLLVFGKKKKKAASDVARASMHRRRHRVTAILCTFAFLMRACSVCVRPRVRKRALTNFIRDGRGWDFFFYCLGEIHPNDRI